MGTNKGAAVKTFTVINIHTHEIACTGKASSAAGRKVISLGANPAGWYKVAGNVADAKAAAAILTASQAERVAIYEGR